MLGHTVKVVAPPGPVPRGQAALREAHFLGPDHLPGLQQGLVRQRVLQGAQEWGQLPVSASRCTQLWGTEESLEGHLGGGRTARGGVVLTGDGGVQAQQVLQGGRLQLGGCVGGTGEPSKVCNWDGEGGKSGCVPETSLRRETILENTRIPASGCDTPPPASEPSSSLWRVHTPSKEAPSRKLTGKARVHTQYRATCIRF